MADRSPVAFEIQELWSLHQLVPGHDHPIGAKYGGDDYLEQVEKAILFCSETNQEVAHLSLTADQCKLTSMVMAPLQMFGSMVVGVPILLKTMKARHGAGADWPLPVLSEEPPRVDRRYKPQRAATGATNDEGSGANNDAKNESGNS